jgi:alkanesulfonate monooxygenase SsuD/methylene tetrahydromethanopterin reductase-like flavin-dependent oxidoreductase (luciferase family)
VPPGGGRTLILGGIDVSGEPAWLGLLDQWLARRFGDGLDAVLFSSIVEGDQALDCAAVIGALSVAAPLGVLGIAAEVGGGRAASVLAREVTTLDHLLPAGSALGLMGGTESHRREAEEVAVAMLGGHGDEVTVEGEIEHVHDAPNRPGPRTPGGPMVLVLAGDGRSATRYWPAAAQPDVIKVHAIDLDGLVTLGGVTGQPDELVMLEGPLGSVRRLRP